MFWGIGAVGADPGVELRHDARVLGREVVFLAGVAGEVVAAAAGFSGGFGGEGCTVDVGGKELAGAGEIGDGFDAAGVVPGEGVEDDVDDVGAAGLGKAVGAKV